MAGPIPNLEFVRAISQAGLDILAKRSAITTLEFVTKDDESPVTHLDEELDARLRLIVGEYFPQDEIISEEGKKSDPKTAKKKNIWWIDPIDGTKEFIKGGPEWVLQLAQSVEGVLTQAFLVYPAKNEVYYAARRQGTFVQAIDKLLSPTSEGWAPQRLAVRQAPPEALIAIGSKSRSDAKEADFLSTLKVENFIQRSSLGLKAAAIAWGEADLYPNFSGLSHLWDLAAPQLVLEEAGGALVRAQAPDYTGHAETRIADSYVLCNAELAEQIKTQLGF